MVSTLNASALATSAARNLNCSSVDENRWLALVEDSVAFARAARAMYLRGEVDIAKEIHAQYKQARRDAEQLGRLIGERND